MSYRSYRYWKKGIENLATEGDIGFVEIKASPKLLSIAVSQPIDRSPFQSFLAAPDTSPRLTLSAMSLAAPGAAGRGPAMTLAAKRLEILSS
jgi:hypothetical protein